MTEVGSGNAIVPPSDLDIKDAAMAGQGHVQGVHKVLAVRSQRERGKKISTSRFRMQIGLVTCNSRDKARRGCICGYHGIRVRYELNRTELEGLVGRVGGWGDLRKDVGEEFD